MIHYAKRWRLFGPAERLRLLRAAAALSVVRLALATLGFRRACRMLDRALAAPPRAVASSGDAAAIARSIERAARVGPGQTRCLARALALWWLLRREGVDAVLRIGVRRVGDGVEGHAWVEHAGMVSLDGQPEAHAYAAFAGAAWPPAATGR